MCILGAFGILANLSLCELWDHAGNGSPLGQGNCDITVTRCPQPTSLLSWALVNSSDTSPHSCLISRDPESNRL